MTSALRVERVDNPAEFADLREEWNTLLVSSSADCLFLTWEWLHTFWTHLAGRRRLHLLVVRSGDQLAAIAPFARRPPALIRLIPYPALEFLGSDVIGSDYLDVIARRGMEQDAVEALAGALPEDLPVLELAQVSREFSLAAELARRLGQRGWRVQQTPRDSCPYVELAGHSWSSYLTEQGPAHFEKRLASLQKRFDVRLDLVQGETQRREALETLVTLHARRWEDRGGSEAFSTPALLAFHDAFTRLALEHGWLRLFVLRLNNTPAAAFLGYRYGPTFCFYQSGFDPAHAKESIGFLTIGLTIRHAIEEGATEYDFLHGTEPYKFRWARRVRDLTRLDLFGTGARGAACRSVAAISSGVRKRLRRLAGDALAERIVTRGLRGIRNVAPGAPTRGGATILPKPTR